MNLLTIPAFSTTQMFHVVVECRPLGVLRVEQNAVNFDRSQRVRTDRILALPVTARRESGWVDIDAIPLRIREKCVQFTLAAAALEGKDLVVLGWGKPHEAIALISASTLTTADR